MRQAGGLCPVVLLHGHRKLGSSDIRTLMAGEASRGPTDGLGGGRVTGEGRRLGGHVGRRGPHAREGEMETLIVILIILWLLDVI